MKYIDEPSMSDKTLILSVEDLIHTAFGTSEQNVLNFKLIQTILHILARQMRLLEQQVEIKLDDLGIDKLPGATEGTGTYAYDEVTASSSASSRDQAGGRDDQDDRFEKTGGDKDKRGKKTSSKDRDDRGGVIDEESIKAGSKDRKGGRGASKEKADKSGSKERGRSKEKETDKGSKERDKGKKGDRGGTGEDRGRSRDDEQGGQGAERGGGQSKDRGGERGTERGGKRGAEREDERSQDRGGEHGGKRGAEREGERGTERGGKRGAEREGERSQDRGGEHGGKRGAEREGERGTERGGKRGAEREGERSQDRGGGKGGTHDAERDAERGGERGSRGREEGKRGRDKGVDTESGRSVPGGQGRSVGREVSRTSITVTESTRKGGRGPQDTVLVVEKGPTTRPGARPSRVGSIEVVTASQFALLEKAVNQLMTVTGPLPMPALPDNEKLRQDLAKGTASLTDTMQAMQLNARVQAAEQGLTRMAAVLTQLAAAGALPEDMAGRIDDMKAELQETARSAGISTSPVLADTDVAAGVGGGAGAGAGAGISSRATPGGAERDKTKDFASQAGGTEFSAAFTSTAAGATLPAQKSVATDAMPAAATPTPAAAGNRTTGEAASVSKASTSFKPQATGTAMAISMGVSGAVTHPEMEDTLQILRDNLLKEVTAMTARASQAADVAFNTSRSIADKLDIAMKMNDRITKLFSQTTDYAEQLSGFDSGLTTQMASFQEQLLQMQTELKGGLTQLEQANNNAETAALLELNERHDTLVIELDNTIHLHRGLTMGQKQLGDELKSLVECVEMLREQKADRDEVLDGLKDKADISRLVGLLPEDRFVAARVELEKRLDLCYDKFSKQEQAWLEAIKDLSAISTTKAEIIQLMALKDTATAELRDIKKALRELFILLGEPKAAVLMRKLAAGAACGACLAPALQEPREPTFAAPHALPPLRPPPEDGPCLTNLHPLPPPDSRRHVCHRWVGGSHTLMGENVSREKAEVSQIQVTPTKRYPGYGTDGKLYMLEEELLPCLECNKLSTDEPEVVCAALPLPADGGGDQAGGLLEPENRNSDEKEAGDGQ